jgi:hypothetical protein
MINQKAKTPFMTNKLAVSLFPNLFILGSRQKAANDQTKANGGAFKWTK